MKHPENFPWLEKMAEGRKEGMTFEAIAHRLSENGVIPAQSPKWTKASVYDRMTNERLHGVKSKLGDNVYDRERAYDLAYAMRTDGNTSGKIAERLNKEGMRPPKASAYWKAQGKSLREIADKLMEAGHRPKRGGQWYAQQAKRLLIS